MSLDYRAILWTSEIHSRLPAFSPQVVREGKWKIQTDVYQMEPQEDAQTDGLQLSQ